MWKSVNIDHFVKPKIGGGFSLCRLNVKIEMKVFPHCLVFVKHRKSSQND